MLFPLGRYLLQRASSIMPPPAPSPGGVPMRLAFAATLASLALAASAPAAQAFTVINNGLIAYRIDGIDNPTLNLVRGQTYTFNVNASGHPFWIKTVNSTGTANAFNNGVTGNGTDVGTVNFVVPMS